MTILPHQPVMLNEVLASLQPRDNALYIDATFGRGGYTRAILNSADCNVMAIDRDPDAIAAGQSLVNEMNGRFSLKEGPFSALAEIALL